MEEPVYHASPDGQLALTASEDEFGNWNVRFHGFDWHIAAAALAEASGLDEAAAMSSFIDEVIADKHTIAVLFLDGAIIDAWITESPDIDREFQQPGEELVFRLWSDGCPD